MKLRTKVKIGSLLVLALAMVWPVAAHYRAKWKVDAYRRQLKSSGEKLTVDELIPIALVDRPNGARVLVTAAARLNSADLSNFPPAMKLLAPGRALVAWKQDVLPDANSTNIWPGLCRLLDQNEDILAEARAALENPVLSFDLNYSQGFNLFLPHLVPVKGVSRWLAASTVLELHEGQSSNAWENLRALVALVERNKTEPLMICELVRIAMGQSALNATWEALQFPGWRDELLQELQTAWASVDFLTQTESALAMERAMGEKVFGEARRSFAVIAGGGFSAGTVSSGFTELTQIGKAMLDDPKGGLAALARRYPGYWAWKGWQSYEDELANMQIIQAGIEATRTARKTMALGPALKQFDQTATALRQAHLSVGKWLGYSLMDDGFVHSLLSRVSTIEIERSMLVTAIALKRCQLKHGAYPQDLAALAPEFLREAPRDAMDGQPLRYRLQPNGSYLLYSVGEDDVDNGGDPTPAETTFPTANKQWWKARDAVWPMPATVEEVKAEFEKVAQSGPRAMALPAAYPPPSATKTSEAEAFSQRYGLSTPTNALPNASTNTVK